MPNFDETTRCYNVPAVISIPEEYIRDLWETAAWHCGYWAAEMTRKDDAHYVREQDPWTDAPDFAFTSDALADAIRRIIEGRVQIAESIRFDILAGITMTGGGEADVDAADCIVQVACFGEIIYS